MRLVDDILQGDKLAIAKAISLSENGEEEAQDILKLLSSHTGKALRIGITGPPGVGKSTIIDAIISILIKQGENIGIIAVDPTSPFSGGALLGDRIRMSKIQEDSRVFMRSMATRGCIGGLAQATYDAVDILDASGKTYILVETVGVGQADICISQLTDCVIVILSPESGDGVQAMKSGLMEIADIVVINKADRIGADKLKYEICSAYEFYSTGKKSVPILLTEAYNGKGVDNLVRSIDDFIQLQKNSGKFQERRQANIRSRINRLVEFTIQKGLWNSKYNDKLSKYVQAILEHKESIYTVTEKLLKEVNYGRKSKRY